MRSVVGVVKSDLFSSVAHYLYDLLFGVSVGSEVEGRREGLVINQLFEGNLAVVVLEDDFPAN